MFLHAFRFLLADFEALSSGALITPYPSEYTCHDPNFDAGRCTKINSSFNNPEALDPTYIASLPGCRLRDQYLRQCLCPCLWL